MWRTEELKTLVWPLFGHVLSASAVDICGPRCGSRANLNSLTWPIKHQSIWEVWSWSLGGVLILWIPIPLTFVWPLLPFENWWTFCVQNVEISKFRCFQPDFIQVKAMAENAAQTILDVLISAASPCRIYRWGKKKKRPYATVSFFYHTALYGVPISGQLPVTSSNYPTRSTRWILIFALVGTGQVRRS